MLTLNYNSQGGIYAQIIDRIIEAAKNDFEEGGYDQSTLVDLKEVSRKHGRRYCPCSNALSYLRFQFISHSSHPANHFGSKMAAMP